MAPFPRTPSTRENNYSFGFRTPPKTTPVRRYSTSRLEQLATPRRSASWTKPIRSKFSRRSTSSSSVSSSKSLSEATLSTNHRLTNKEASFSDLTWEEFASTNQRLSAGQDEIDWVLGQSKMWRQEMSPKIDQLLSSIALSPSRSEDGITAAAQRSKQGYLSADNGDWNDSYSASDDSENNSSVHSETRDEGAGALSALYLQQRVDILTRALARQDKCISSLKAEVKEKDDQIANANSRTSPQANRGSARVHGHTKSSIMAHGPFVEANEVHDTSTHMKSTTMSTSRMSIDSIRSVQGCSNDLILELSRELDTKLSEIDQLKQDHEMQIDRMESELFEKEEQIVAMNANSPSTNQTVKDSTSAVQVEMLAAALAKLKEEHKSLKQSFHLGKESFNTALIKNCRNIMNYVREELASLPANELRAYNDALQYELQLTRWENAELKSELQRITYDRDALAAKLHKQRVKPTSATPIGDAKPEPDAILSPLPTFESWAHFCVRFKEALNGTNQHIRQKLVLDNNGTKRADNLFKELCFAREGTPLRQRNTVQGNGIEDIFIDALSESDN